MSNSLTIYENQYNECCNNSNDSKLSSNFYNYSFSCSYRSPIYSISKNEFTRFFHFLCKKCNNVPVLKFFIKKNKIQYICNCEESPRELYTEEIFDLLSKSEDNEIEEIKKLKCPDHEEEIYIFYCVDCKKNICTLCNKNCEGHKRKSICYDVNTVDKGIYIINKINPNDTNHIEEDNELDFENETDINMTKYLLIPKKNLIKKDEIDINTNSNLIKSNEESGEKLVLVKKESKKTMDIKKEEFNDVLNDINNDFSQLNEYSFKDLIIIILDDYQKYPSFNSIETISNIEKYIRLILKDYNEINLNYEFKQNDIIDNSIELFGEKFVKHNKKKCFLLINEKMLELNRFINLSDIFDFNIDNFPIKLDIKLIERKNNPMNDLSYMFFGVSTITSKSKFDKYDSINVIKANHMFYNCQSLEEIPDISQLNTKNVNDTSFMFFNCSLLKSLPDISKWNTENIENMSNMFHNCLSLISLPNISSWNIHNIKYTNGMFKNCKSLSNIPDLSNWNLKNIQDKEMFSGCSLLEKQFQEYNGMTIFKKILYYIIIFMNKMLPCFSALGILIIVSLILFYILPIYLAFSFDILNENNFNITEFFNMTNITQIEHISKLLNKSIIKELEENNKTFINNLINFTEINGGDSIESNIKKTKINNIIFGIIILIGLILFSLIYFRFRDKILEKIKNRIIALAILFVINIILVIIKSIDLCVFFKLANYFNKLFKKIKDLFLVENPKIYSVTLYKIAFFGMSNMFSLFESIILIIFIIIWWKNLIWKKVYLNTFNDYLFYIDYE